MHCSYIEEYGKTYVGSKWETKHPYLGCHPKKGYTVKDLVRLAARLPRLPNQPRAVRQSRGAPCTPRRQLSRRAAPPGRRSPCRRSSGHQPTSRRWPSGTRPTRYRTSSPCSSSGLRWRSACWSVVCGLLIAISMLSRVSFWAPVLRSMPSEAEREGESVIGGESEANGVSGVAGRGMAWRGAAWCGVAWRGMLACVRRCLLACRQLVPSTQRRATAPQLGTVNRGCQPERTTRVELPRSLSIVRFCHGTLWALGFGPRAAGRGPRAAGRGPRAKPKVRRF